MEETCAEKFLSLFHHVDIVLQYEVWITTMMMIHYRHIQLDGHIQNTTMTTHPLNGVNIDKGDKDK